MIMFRINKSGIKRKIQNQYNWLLKKEKTGQNWLDISKEEQGNK